jgi:phage N-6-adenine-methyltransferase
MTEMTDFRQPTPVTKHRKRRRKIGRPTVRRNGVVLSGSERTRRWRQRRKRLRKETNYEWYTPANVIAAVRRALGGRIDCDPATSELAQTVVKAKIYYTIAEDGLTQPWHGTVWLNPPYSRQYIERFVDKLLAEIRAGNVTAAILLVHPKIDTAWWNKAAAASSCFCFTKRRIRFWSPTKMDAYSPMSGSVFLYYGRHVARFRSAFKSFGRFYYAQQSSVPHPSTLRKMYLYLSHIDGLPPVDQIRGKTLIVR